MRKQIKVRQGIIVSLCAGKKNLAIDERKQTQMVNLLKKAKGKSIGITRHANSFLKHTNTVEPWEIGYLALLSREQIKIKSGCKCDGCCFGYCVGWCF